MDNPYNDLRKVHDQARRDNEERYKLNSRKRLMKTIERKFNTTMIGALAKFEEHFGSLWGHGCPPHERTLEERQWFEAWQEVRTAVLNNGNNQLRASLDEIAQYTMTWNRFQATFLPQQDIEGRV